MHRRSIDVLGGDARPRCSSRSSAVALLRGRSSAPSAGFCAGLLLDTATLGTLGLTSLLLTRRRLLDRPLRRDDGPRPRPRAVPRRSPSSTVLYALGALALHFMLGDAGRRRGSCSSTRSCRPGRQPAAHRAGLRARRAASCRRATGAPSARGRCRLAWLATHRPGRFLPADPRVEEPYRSRRSWRCASRSSACSRSSSSRPLPAALGAAGALRRRSTSRTRRTTSCAPCASRRRAGRSSTATAAARHERRRAPRSSSGRPTCRSTGRVRGCCSALATCSTSRSPRSRREIDERGSDPLTPVIDQGRRRARTRSPTSTSTRREFPGVQIAQTYLRQYPQGSLAAQVLGYVGEISPSS